MYRTLHVHCLIVSLIYLNHKPSSLCTLRVVQGRIERIVHITLKITVASHILFKEIIEHSLLITCFSYLMFSKTVLTESFKFFVYPGIRNTS